ncbi:cell death-inducing p53-target protein 1 homolog isoform X2 [Pseudorasbora parva]|uniref:cell death-inducing p53-target protein 1 homolog isoform X2 n=1 Tax=Pseudorasbora parva TaxID=51549 RepID=UPI00351EA287
MEKEYAPPPYPGPQPTQTDMNYPGPQAPYPGPQAPHPPQTDPQAAPYQPPPYGFGGPSINVQPTMIPVVTQMVDAGLTDVPRRVICRHCMMEVTTEIEHINGALTWLICAGLAIFVCWFCCFIPFCVDSWKDVKHTCPNCKNVIHIYKRM